MRLTLFAGLFVCGGAVSAQASCDVKDFIFDDKIVYTADDVVRLSVLSEIEGNMREDRANKIDSAMLVPGYFQGNYNQDQRSSIVQRQYRMLNLDLSQESRRTIIASHLSDNSVAMYKACLDQYGLTLEAPPHAMYSKQFSIEMHYRPGADGKPADLFKDKKPVIVVTNGKIDDGYLPLLPKQIRPDEKLRILIERDLNETTEIFANVGGTTASIALPPQTNSKITFQRKEKSETASAYKGHPSDTKEFCYVAADGEVVFPETATLIIDRVLPPNDKNKAELLKDKSNEAQVCAKVQAVQFDDFTGGLIEATIAVEVGKVVAKQAAYQPTNAQLIK